MAKKQKNNMLPSKADTVKFEMLSELLYSLILETKELSKKKPDEALNKLKIKMINRVLEQVKEILKKEATDEFLDLLDETAIPSNSDAVLILGQFRAAMDQFRSKYFGKSSDFGPLHWFTKENQASHYKSPY